MGIVLSVLRAVQRSRGSFKCVALCLYAEIEQRQNEGDSSSLPAIKN